MIREFERFYSIAPYPNARAAPCTGDVGHRAPGLLAVFDLEA